MSDPRAQDYQSALASVMTAARLLSVHDLEGLLAAIGRAQSVGPLLDPTLYRDKREALEQDAEAFRAALPLWRLAKTIQERTAAHVPSD